MLEDQTQQVDEPANLVVSHLEGIDVRDQHAGFRRDPGRQAVLDEEDRLLRKAVFNLFFQVGGRDGDGGRPRHQRLGERKQILRWYPERDREFREVPDQIIEIDQVRGLRPTGKASVASGNKNPSRIDRTRGYPARCPPGRTLS